MAKETKTRADASPKVDEAQVADSPGLIDEGELIEGTVEETETVDLKATIATLMDHVLALTAAVSSIAVGGRRPQNVKELGEAQAQAQDFRNTL